MLPQEALGRLAERFRRFSVEAGAQSPLYERLSLVAADDEVALAILALARDERQRRPNLLFAAVHDLLLAGLDHPLAAHYPTVHGTTGLDTTDAERHFKSLLREHREQLEQRVESKATQTNEVGRCTALWPAIQTISVGRARGLALIELGASAGLLLHLDRYAYRYRGVPSGNPSSQVKLSPQVVGEAPPLPGLGVPIVRRIGIDLTPCDPADERDSRWLKACVWPEDVKRLDRLTAALGIARQHRDVEMRQGDFMRLLPDVLDNCGIDVLPVVMHSAALAYLDASARDRLAAAVADVAQHRNLVVVSFEGPFTEPYISLDRAQTERPAGEQFLLGLATFDDGKRSDRLLARAHPHGAWLQWLHSA